MNPFAGILLALALTALLMWGLRVFQRHLAPHPEWSRKLMHMGSGLVALSFPWLFDRAWPVVVLCIVAAAGMAAIKRSAVLKMNIGSVIGSVGRDSLGEVYFPLTIALLFVLARGDVVLYCIPVLILTFADAAAALVGIFYGARHYDTSEGKKSTEGSVAFFLVAFFSTHVPLLLFTDVTRGQSLMVALLLGFLLMIIEAIGWKGLDNILIPLLGLIMLKASLETSVLELSLQALITFGLWILVFTLKLRTTLSSSALLGAVFVGYLSWTLGGWRWVVAPLVLFLITAIMFPRRRQEARLTHHFQVVLAVCGAGLAWLFLRRAFDDELLIVPFIVAFSAQLAMIAVRHFIHRIPQPRMRSVVVASIVVGWLPIFVPYAILGMFRGFTVKFIVWSIIAVALAASLFYRKYKTLVDTGEAPIPWPQQAVYGAVVSLFGLFPAGIS